MGLAILNKSKGRGAKPANHISSHAWPSMCSAIVTMVDDNKVDPLLDALHKLDTKLKN